MHMIIMYLMLAILSITLSQVLEDGPKGEIITTKWVKTNDFSIKKNTDNRFVLPMSHAKLLEKFYKDIEVEPMDSMLSNHLAKIMNNEKPEILMDIDHHMLNEFERRSIYLAKNRHIIHSCGATTTGGFIVLSHCPGTMTVMTMSTVSIMSCKSLSTAKFFGPILLIGKECQQHLIVFPDCETATNKGFVSTNCLYLKDHTTTMVWAYISISINILLIILIASLITFVIRLQRMKTNRTITFSKSGLKQTYYTTYTASEGKVLLKERTTDVTNLEKKELVVPKIKLILIMLCFLPIPSESYDLLSSQKLSDNMYKYTISLGDGEMIHLGSTKLGFQNAENTIGLTKQFYTYDWEVRTHNGYACRQAVCDEILDCREDLLPFRPAGEATAKFLNLDSHEHLFHTCKTLRAYCNFANGCMILAYQIFLHDMKRVTVYTTHHQTVEMSDIVLPPGCFLDSMERETTANLESMYYLESEVGETWFCHSSLYSHYPTPHSLGDIKVNDNGTINFINDHIKCATDPWRDVMCTYPESFLSNINKYCTEATKKNLGIEIKRTGDYLSWNNQELVTARVTCDRPLDLKVSEEHCSDILLEVWDLEGGMNDYLLSVSGNSKTHTGVVILPKAIHLKTHIFPCDAAAYSTVLYDLRSLNSTGLNYTFHSNRKELVNNRDSKVIDNPEHSESGWGMDLSGLWNKLGSVFGGSAIGLTALIIIIGLCFIMRK